MESDACRPSIHRQIAHQALCQPYPLQEYKVKTVASGHGLILPKRHPALYFSLSLPPMNAESAQHLMIFSEESILQMKELLASPRKIVITTHQNPDGDAMGSSLALFRAMRALGHDALVITPNAFDHFLAWLPDADTCLDGKKFPTEAAQHFKDADIICCLDYSALKRAFGLQEMIATSTATKVMIDHHIDPEDWPDLLFHVEGISSTAELVYRLLLQLGHSELIDKGTAECIYTGLMTDTGSFRFSSTTSDVHRIAADLLDRGIEVGRIHNLVYDNFNESRNRFLGYLLHKKLKVLPELNTAYITISKHDIRRFKVKTGDTEGVVNYTLSLKGIHFGVLMKETPEGTKMSFRSIGSFPCNEFASHFGGGGHHNAAGGKANLNIEETEQKFLGLLNEYQAKLKY